MTPVAHQAASVVVHPFFDFNDVPDVTVRYE